MKLKKIFTTEGLKVIFSFMMITMLIILGFELFLMKYFEYANVATSISVVGFWWHVIGVASIYSLLLLIIFWILSYFDK